jgi:hypothetical protein
VELESVVIDLEPFVVEGRGGGAGNVDGKGLGCVR